MLKQIFVATLLVVACVSLLVSLLDINPVGSLQARQYHHDLNKRGNEGGTPRLPYGTAPLNATQLPGILSTRTDWNKDSQSIDSIRNKLAVYAYAVDGKEFSVLNQVFSASAVANYSSSLGTLNGEIEISAALSRNMTNSTTQHLLASTFVLFSDLRDAFSVTNFQVTTFAKEGTSQAFGQFQDSWFRRNSRTQDWQIVYRNVIWTR